MSSNIGYKLVILFLVILIIGMLFYIDMIRVIEPNTNNSSSYKIAYKIEENDGIIKMITYTDDPDQVRVVDTYYFNENDELIKLVSEKHYMNKLEAIQEWIKYKEKQKENNNEIRKFVELKENVIYDTIVQEDTAPITRSDIKESIETTADRYVVID